MELYVENVLSKYLHENKIITNFQYVFHKNIHRVLYGQNDKVVYIFILFIYAYSYIIILITIVFPMVY